MAAAQFLRDLVNAVAYHIHTVLTDNGIPFTNHKRHRLAGNHIFDRVCAQNGIEHRSPKSIILGPTGRSNESAAQSRTLPSNAITMTITSSRGATSMTSLMPTTSPKD